MSGAVVDSEWAVKMAALPAGKRIGDVNSGLSSMGLASGHLGEKIGVSRDIRYIRIYRVWRLGPPLFQKPLYGTAAERKSAFQRSICSFVLRTCSKDRVAALPVQKVHPI